MKIKARNSEVKIDLLILYHLLSRVIFVSHYKMMSPLEYVTCHTMSNVREKSDHVTCTLFGNIAFISNRIYIN